MIPRTEILVYIREHPGQTHDEIKAALGDFVAASILCLQDEESIISRPVSGGHGWFVIPTKLLAAKDVVFNHVVGHPGLTYDEIKTSFKDRNIGAWLLVLRDEGKIVSQPVDRKDSVTGRDSNNHGWFPTV